LPRACRAGLCRGRYQYGPNCVRDGRDLRAAKFILAERGRARMKEDGRRRGVMVNPALLDGRD